MTRHTNHRLPASQEKPQPWTPALRSPGLDPGPARTQVLPRRSRLKAGNTAPNQSTARRAGPA